LCVAADAASLFIAEHIRRSGAVLLQPGKNNTTRVFWADFFFYSNRPFFFCYTPDDLYLAPLFFNFFTGKKIKNKTTLKRTVAECHLGCSPAPTEYLK
jgi:hypothetical protein